MEVNLNLGDIVEVKVTRITDFGAFVEINGRGLGLIHISQVADTFVKDINQHLKVGDRLKARIIKLGPGKKIDLSLKSGKNSANRQKKKPWHLQKRSTEPQFRASNLEEKLTEFLEQSRGGAAW